MTTNRGKSFEEVVKDSFLKVPGVSIDRIHDQTTRYKGSTNVSDFIVYKKPFEYYIECKSVHGNTLSISSIPKPDKKGVLHGFYGNITDGQWEGLLEKSTIPGVTAGVMCWWVEKDVTRFIPIQALECYRNEGHKSVRFDAEDLESIVIEGCKKRVFFDYDMTAFFKEVENGKRTRTKNSGT